MLKLELVSKSLYPSPISLDTSETVGGTLGFGTLTSSIETTARSPLGFNYFWAVDRGRRGFSVKNAKALRFKVGGKYIFRKSVGPAAPRYITQRALGLVSISAQNAVATARATTFTAWLKAFLNAIADYQLTVFQRFTPQLGSGKLAAGYRVRKVQ